VNVTTTAEVWWRRVVVNTLYLIIVVALRRTQLGWVTVFGQVQHLGI